MKLTIAEHDTAWTARFERERERIGQALGERAVRIEHIGSTAVPGLAAKPVIDVLVAVNDIRDPHIEPALRAVGFELHVDEPEHRMYRTPQIDVHVHLWAADSPEIDRHLKFRDWLRTHPADRELYEHVKRKLAGREWTDRNDYADAKTPVINAIVRRANGQATGPRIDAFASAISQYVSPPARVLEIGAGEGELAYRLTARGYAVVALDRSLRSTFPIVESSFEEYEAEPESFDCVAAQLVLHHADDVQGMLRKASRLLRRGGIIAIDDYGWERSDDPAFRTDRADLHTSETMLRGLRAQFDELAYFDHAYFDEGAGTDRLGFTFIGAANTACTR
jgi:GrpB-like predicted nucleotidyltransferase (UPF0157 family)